MGEPRRGSRGRASDILKGAHLTPVASSRRFMAAPTVPQGMWDLRWCMDHPSVVLSKSVGCEDTKDTV